MAVSLALTRYDPEPAEAPERFHVGYVVTLDGGQQLYSVTTVYAADLADTDEATVLAAAEAVIRPDAEARNGP